MIAAVWSGFPLAVADRDVSWREREREREPLCSLSPAVSCLEESDKDHSSWAGSRELDTAYRLPPLQFR